MKEFRNNWGIFHRKGEKAIDVEGDTWSKNDKA